MLESSELGAAAGRGERYADAGEITLCYDEFGDRDEPTVVLVMGLGMQLIAWDDELCELLVEHGFHVIRFDNLDVGLSTKLAGRVNIAAGMVGLTGSAAYTLDEMAADTVGLLDHLELERAHLVGASMGGMICQQVAARYAERVGSLCSIMSGSGRRLPSRMPRPGVFGTLFRPPAESREQFVEDLLDVFARIGSPGYPTDPERLRARLAASYDRSYYPPGVARQLMAVLASGNRTAQLGRIAAPTLVVHGTEDRLVPPRAGHDVAEAIAGSELKLIAGMGHDLPVQLWPRLAELVAANARRTA